MNTFCKIMNGGVMLIATSCSPPTVITLSKQDVAFNKPVLLKWSGAKGGTANPIKEYAVYKNDKEIARTTSEQFSLTSSSVAGTDVYYVITVGKAAGYDSKPSGKVSLIVHAPEHVDNYYTASGTYTVPAWAERIDVTVIGGGAGGTSGGKDEGDNGGCPGGGGGSAYISHAIGYNTSPGKTHGFSVASGGGTNNNSFMQPGYKGGESSFGTLHAAGGQPGLVDGGYASPSSSASGGMGGNGGGGGAKASGGNGGLGGNGYKTYGGGRNASTPPNRVAIHGKAGGGGSFGGTNGSLKEWNSTSNTGGYLNSPAAELYCFRDPSTRRYLGSGGKGGNGGGGYGAYGGYGKGISGTSYGTGGNGGNRWSNGSPGSKGLVAVRAWRYL